MLPRLPRWPSPAPGSRPHSDAERLELRRSWSSFQPFWWAAAAAAIAGGDRDAAPLDGDGSAATVGVCVGP